MTDMILSGATASEKVKWDKRGCDANFKTGSRGAQSHYGVGGRKTGTLLAKAVS